jgi:putative peptide zinc metalloprotease protein
MLTNFADSATSSTNRPLRMRKRPDLVSARHTYQHRPYWVVKEPVGLKYFRFHEQEYEILQMLDGQNSLEQIKDKFERKFAPERVSFGELQQLIGMLHRSGLVVSDSPGQGDQLWLRGKEQTKKRRMAALTNVFAVRWKGVDPDRLLNWLYPRTKWMFTRAAVTLCVLLCLSALALILIQFGVFRSRLPAFHEFFGPKNWIYLGLTLAFVKVIHEFGHGLSCKHFGGECHEIGFMLLVFTPALYCNVSDSWMLRSKWQRASIGAAGIYVELVMASTATFVWWFTEPGMLNYLALNVMFLCSISTIMFNGNPLLRFDGYYILADVVEIPNLRQKATEVLRRGIFRWCLGIDLPDDPFLPTRNRVLMGAYTIAAVVYRWIVVVSILLFLNKVLEPYGLKILGQMLGAIGFFGLVVSPVIQTVKFFRVPGRMHEVKRKRVAVSLTALTGILLLVALIPLPHRVQCAMIIEPADAKTAYVDTPGRLHLIITGPNQHVAKDEPLVQLQNLDLELRMAERKRNRDDLKKRIENLELQQLNGQQTGLQVAEAKMRLRTAETQINTLSAEHKRLTIVAPESGMVFPMPASEPKPTDEDDTRLPTWTGTPLDQRNLGVTLDKAQPICRIGDPHRVVAVLVVDEADVDFVEPGNKVDFVLDAYSGRRFRGVVVEVASRKMTQMPPALGAQQGGDVATRTDREGTLEPLNASYKTEVSFDDEDKLLLGGLRGTAKINVGYETLGRRAYRFFARTFRFTL